MLGRGNSMCKNMEARMNRVNVVYVTRAHVSRSGGREKPGREVRLDPPVLRGLPRHQNLTVAVTGRKGRI